MCCGCHAGETCGVGFDDERPDAAHNKKRPVQPPGHTWYGQQRMNKTVAQAVLRTECNTTTPRTALTMCVVDIPRGEDHPRRDRVIRDGDRAGLAGGGGSAHKTDGLGQRGFGHPQPSTSPTKALVVRGPAPGPERNCQAPPTSSEGCTEGGGRRGGRGGLGGNLCTARVLHATFRLCFPLKSPQTHPLETPLELGDPNCPSSRKLQTTFP